MSTTDICPCRLSEKTVPCFNEQCTPEEISSGSGSNEGMASHDEDEPRHKLDKNLRQTELKVEEGERCDKGGTSDVTSTDQSEGKGQEAKNSLHLRCHDNQFDTNNQNGARPNTEAVQTESTATMQSGSTIGRVIMIDGIKFVAVTCLEPPKGHCRTCSVFGSLLYFSARSCYILEAAEKFCSVRCARKFINEKRSCHTPSRQPSGDVGSSVSVPRSRVVKHHRGKQNVEKRPDSRDAKGRDMKSKQASRDAATLTGLYVDSLVIETKHKVRNSVKGGRKRDHKSEGTDRHLSPPLPEQLDKVKLEAKSPSDTSAQDKCPKSIDQNMSTSSDKKAINPDLCHREEIGTAQKGVEKEKEKPLQKTRSSGQRVSSASSRIDAENIEEVSVKETTQGISFPSISSSVWKNNDLKNAVTIGKKKGQKEKPQSIPPSRRACIVERFPLQQGHRHSRGNNPKETFSVSTKSLRNVPKKIPSTSKTKLWKKYGAKFQTRSCEFSQEEMTKVDLSRDCHTPDPTSKGLVMSTTTRNIPREKDGTAQSLNQFHERRRSLFKTMFPFQETLGTRAPDDPSKSNSPGEETPSEPSVVEDCGDVSTSVTRRTSSGTPSTISCVFNKECEANARLGLPCRKTSQKVLDNHKQDGGRHGSKWANLFQLMIEASDWEDTQKGKVSNDRNKQKQDKNSVKDKTETTDVAFPKSGTFGGAAGAEEQIMEEKVGEDKSKKKKKKKKRKRKKKKRSNQNTALEFLTTPTVDDKKHIVKKHPGQTPTRSNRKENYKNKQSRRESESPTSPVDPDDWPKWRGDGKKRMDMMTSIDHLMWTLKNKFQPNIGRSSSFKVNGTLNVDSP